MPLPAVDWELYRRLKAEGRLNLLFHFSEAAAAGVQCAEAPTSRSKLLPFVSRAEHLAWRARWKNGRWVKLSWTPEQRDAILRQDEAYRQATSGGQNGTTRSRGSHRSLCSLNERTCRSYSMRGDSGPPCHGENVAHDGETKPGAISCCYQACQCRKRRISTEQERGAELQLFEHSANRMTGTMDEPIRDTRDVEIVLYAADDPKPGRDPTPWIGLVHGIRPVMRAAIFIPHRDFDRVWSLALSGLLKHAHIVPDATALSVGLRAQHLVLDAPGGVTPTWIARKACPDSKQTLTSGVSS